MKANELRLGNYVRHEGFKVKIVGITNDLVSVQYLAGISDVRPDKITPILLTGDILLKCGFKFEKEKEELYGTYVIEFEIDDYYWKMDTLCLFCKDKTLSSFFYKDRIQIKYLHQLQNLYFALTGEELEVKF